MNTGDTVYVVGVKAFPTNITEGIFAGLRLPGLAVFSGKAVTINEDSVAVDIPNGHNSPWTKPKGEVFEKEEDALNHLKDRLNEMRKFFGG